MADAVSAGSLLVPNKDSSLAKIAAGIRSLKKRSIKTVVEIGKLLCEAEETSSCDLAHNRGVWFSLR
jgi:hypothetical protein